MPTATTATMVLTRQHGSAPGRLTTTQDLLVAATTVDGGPLIVDGRAYGYALRARRCAS
jgi:hypothetical protein